MCLGEPLALFTEGKGVRDVQGSRLLWGNSARNHHERSYCLLFNSLHFKIFSLPCLRLCHTLIKDQAKELTRLYQKLRKGKDVSQLLNKLLEDLLTHDDPEHSQGQGFQEQLAEGRRLAKCLARKLSPGKAATGPDARSCAKALGSQETPRLASRRVQQPSWVPHRKWGHERTRSGRW